MKTAILVTDGVGVRNFLLGPHPISQMEDASSLILHGIPEEYLSLYVGNAAGQTRFLPFSAYKETPLSSTLRYSLAYAQMYWGDTFSMRRHRNKPVQGSWRTRAMRRTARLIGRSAANPAGIRLLDRQHSRVVGQLPEADYYRQLFKDEGTSILFCTHQRPPVILPPVLAARSLGIPTVTFIFSWDNLTSKGRIAAPFDHYFVWSENMKGELLRYYPDVTADRVHVVGTPQFDPYADDSLLWSREEFFQRIGGDSSRPLICYSGGDTGTCPEDHRHVAVLMSLIRAGKIQGNPQVLVRPAPVDDGTRYGPVRQEYPEMIFAQPSWVHTHPGDWSQVIPLPEDVQFLANLTHHADLNVNLASTMTLDFALHDKPVVNVGFDVASPPPFKIPLWDLYYQFEHYKPVVGVGAVKVARSPEELGKFINDYLKDPNLDRAGRQQLVEMQVGTPLGEASVRIAQLLKELSR